ncbi:YihY/virulence factor BrkB family protein [Chelativorans sp. AA-79]|uniref:YihY/virulence factor BrkB family protein n=1 Tax=Chelativorans sp. AA-79 TaxID=3028735 RepID=UPI0023F6F88F|nr:YihY/virulence factor BrkB family protein [Chelativorans sp. AA-79]WEX09744.1 YihY/virulence factor BrkB family protein [Chelativorans sp. AA-79]
MVAEADESSSERDARGRGAYWPSQIPITGWKDVAWRVRQGIGADRVLLIAAGVTFYLLLALFPALAAFVSLYGFFAEPDRVTDHIAFLGGLLPSAALDIIRQQMEALATQDRSALSFGFIFGLVIALWSANGGIKALFQAMNVAYGEEEKRGFVKLNLLSLAFTLGAILLGIGFILAVGIVPALLALLQLGRWAELAVTLLRWPLLMILIIVGIALLYRFGPSREQARWRWLSWGAVFATIVWVAASLAFSFYLQNFADYNATYGSLGAVIGLMMWIWISVAILIIGAEIDAEIEHQTTRDSTTGRSKPIGERGAVVADTKGEAAPRDR